MSLYANMELFWTLFSVMTSDRDSSLLQFSTDLFLNKEDTIYEIFKFSLCLS